MNIYQKGKCRYITSVINGRDYNLTTGHFKRYLNKLSISLADYFEKHEGIERDKCNVCDKPAAFFGYHSDNSVKWHSVCGEPMCAKVMYSRAHLSRAPENWTSAAEKRRKTFEEHPEILASRTKIIHEANLKVGDDGLTGYERTARRRRQTLFEKHGREDYANWGKTKATWANKTEENVAVHGQKISDNWAAKSDEQKQIEINKREQTKLEKYGKPGWRIAYEANKSRYSTIASDFCSIIQHKIKEKLLFDSDEMCISGKYFDLTSAQNKKIIEFNGDFWHAKPSKYKATDVIPISGKTAQNVWDSDAAKIKLAEDAGYQVKVVWESEYKKNPKKIIEECVAWLKQ